MKLKGQKLSNNNLERIFIPRGDSYILFEARPIQDTNEFNKIYPIPEAPKILLPGGKKGTNPEDEKYKEALEQWTEVKLGWLVVNSLKATEGLEWELVNPDNPVSYAKWKDELRESEFTEIEIVNIFKGVLAVNGLSEEKVEAARNSFLAGQAQEQSP